MSRREGRNTSHLHVEIDSELIELFDETLRHVKVFRSRADAIRFLMIEFILRNHPRPPLKVNSIRLRKRRA